MMKLVWMYKILLFLIFNNTATAHVAKDYEKNDYFLVEMKDDDYIDNVKRLHKDWKYEYSIDYLDKFHVFSIRKNHTDVSLFENSESIETLVTDLSLAKRNDDLISSLHANQVNGIHPLKKKKLYKRLPVPVEHDVDDWSMSKRKEDSVMEELSKISQEFQINDPIFKDQWHIKNPAFPGHDVNVVPVWRMNITGKGVVTALIDDGLDYESPDLKDNFCAEGSWDYNDNRPNPKPMLSNDYHGTRCAAEIAASKGNDYCGVGVAYDSKVSGIRILSGEITSEQEAAAMIYGLDVNDIYSCSWGPPDNGRSMDAPDKLIKSAILKGVQDGRNGKGALYVFASGNGGTRGDTCNFDGYTNSIYSLTVSAIDHKGLHPGYSESCTAVMVSTYSSGSGEHIHTTDINDSCTSEHGGTSAAAPLAAGIYALILEANPELTWRDIQYLTVLSASEIDPYNESWQDSAIPNRKYSPTYGWGKIDAEKMVNMAKDNWKLLKPQSWYYTPYQVVGKKLSSETGELEDTFVISSEILKKANLETIEQLTVTVNIESDKRGDVEIDLVSPNGIVSKLANSRPRDNANTGFRNWTFSTVAHWGESAEGKWTIKVRNVGKNNSINFKNWQLRAFGECIDPLLAKRFDIDEDYSVINSIDENPTNSSIGKPSTSGESMSETYDETATATQLSNTATLDSEESTTSLETTDSLTASATEEPTSSTSAQLIFATAEPSGDNNKDVGNGSYTEGNPNSHRSITYFFIILVIGIGAIAYITKNRARPGRARRREDFEFDIIHPEDDESSRFEFDDDDDDDDSDEYGQTERNFSSNEDKSNDKDKLVESGGKFTPQESSKNSSELDLGSPHLSGFSKSKVILDDARAKEMYEDRMIRSKQQGKTEANAPYDNLEPAEITSNDDTDRLIL